MHMLLISFDYWRRLLLVYTIIMGVEAPLLLFVAALRRRPWREHALALLPAGGFGVGLYLVRSADVVLAAWQSYVTFQQVHYPLTYWSTFAPEWQSDLQTLVDSIQQQAVATGALTLVLLMGGWLLLLRWLPNSRHEAHPAPKQFTSALVSEDDLAADDSLEITIEPIERKRVH